MTDLFRFLRFALLLVVVMALSLVTIGVLAQEATPEPDAPPVEEPPAEPVDDGTIDTIWTVTFFSATITLMAVSFVKRLPPFVDVPAERLQIAIGGLLTLAFWLASWFGLSSPFLEGVNVVEQLGAVLLGAIGSWGVSKAAHEGAKALGVPVIGYSRD